MKMAQPPPDQNFYHPHPHPHPHHHTHPQPQLQLPPQFRNPFELIFDERTGGINYNYIRPYIPNPLSKPDDITDPLVMRRPRRTRTTFTSAQITELEKHFLQGRYLTSSRLVELSAKLALGTAQVKIWFKNRRRRHKIQSVKQKDVSCDSAPSSPSVPIPVKTETHSSCGSNKSSGSSNGGPPSLHSLSLNGSGGSTPNALTPSPTPTTPTTNLMEHYGESVFNPYYYNNHHAHASHHHRAHHTSLTHPYAAAGLAGAQYYPPQATGRLQQHQNQHQQQYHAAHTHQFQMQHKLQTNTFKEDPDYNFINPYYMRMPTSATLVGNTGATSVEPSTAMSPNSEVYEPLTPKNDENSSVCNGADTADDSNETKSKLQVLVANNANGTDDACNNSKPIGNEGTGTSTINIVEDCTGAFAKFQKMAADANDPNYQCTMDTLIHVYNNHRNQSNNAQQFATYCFN